MPFALNQGVRIHYEVTGSGPVVLLLHGVGSTGQIWTQIGAVERLASRFTVVTSDARGLGRSDRPTTAADYRRELRRDDTIAVLDAVGADRAHLVGYSLGGRSAFRVAAHQPERIISVVAGGANPYSMRLNAELTAHLQPQGRGPATRNLMMRVRGKLRSLTGHRPTPSVQQLIRAADSQGVDTDPASEAITMPVYLFTGEHDQSFDVGLTRQFAESLPHCQFEVIEGEDHGMLRRLTPLLPRIEQFLIDANTDA